ncbi:DUF1295 domain-containing protein [Rhizomicrobium electricum]|nr:DUF1295 domain-containing protein [Rhizomicrobium electricum]NIJ46707.1 steroid 5-alpha reductase family enzyme [Rhizomicrobium electricum]
MAAAWLVQQRHQTSRWVDSSWTFSVGLVGAIVALVPFDADPLRQVLLAVVALFWSVRLGGHLMKRNAKIADDPRYAHLARQWGAAAAQRMFFFLQSQALVGAVLAIAVGLAAHHPGRFGRVQDIVGAGLALIAVGGEALADYQLALHRRSGNGAICERGLWSWSRHPNYFFEWLGWLAIAIIAADGDGSYVFGSLAFAAPAVMYWTLVYVSGIPPLEMHLQKTRGSTFAHYQSRVSRFFPWPPKRGRDAS